MPSLTYQVIDKIASLFGYSLPSLEENPEAKRAATRSARRWLALIDEEKYSDGWRQSVPQFQEAMPEKEWVEKIRVKRAPFGSVRSREVSLSRYAASFPSPVDGEHVIVQFDTEFESKKRAKETVTFAKTKDGSWRSVGGYKME